METTAPRTWKSTTAGVLNIISGSLRAFIAIALIFIIAAGNSWRFFMAAIPPAQFPFVAPMLNTLLILLLIASISETIFPILGGVFALKRRRWGWALAGSIVAIFGMFPLGVASTIFVAMAKDEFE